MDDRLDLDRVMEHLALRIPGWRASGVDVADPTWRDEADGWPQQLDLDRSDARRPDSVGVRCSKGEREGSLVVFRGGWADLEYWAGGQSAPVVEAPGWNGWLDLERVDVLLDRFGSMFG